MSLRHAILGIVELSPMHGYQLKAVLEEGISTFWPVNLAGIYPSLRRLEEEGLVTHCSEDSGEGRPARKVYAITEEGRAEMARWRGLAPEGTLQPGRNPLFLKLFFARDENLPDALGWIDKEMEAVRGYIATLEGELHNPEIFSTLAIRFMRETGLAHAELQLEMLQDLKNRVHQRIEAIGEPGSELPPDDRRAHPLGGGKTPI